MQNMYPLSSQALRPKNPNFSIPHATPRHRTRDCQIRGHKEIMHQIYKCEQREQETQERKFFFEASVD